MATLPSWYEDDLTASTSENAGTPKEGGVEDSYRVRLFPNEDIMLWVKPIDNSRVMRDSDPQLLEACWRFITVASVAVIVVVGLLLPNAYGMLSGYQIHKLEQERAMLLREREALELEESRLLSPKRLEELAEMQRYVDPPPDKVVYLTPQADGSLALARQKQAEAPAPAAQPE
jgi:hypothetical protein